MQIQRAKIRRSRANIVKNEALTRRILHKTRDKKEKKARERERKGTLKVERKGRKGKESGNVDETS